MTTSRVVKTVKVLIHLDGRGNVALGVIESEWHGARRVDRRLSSARPVDRRASDAPPGVSAAVWLALAALERVVQEQEEAQGRRGL